MTTIKSLCILLTITVFSIYPYLPARGQQSDGISIVKWSPDGTLLLVVKTSGSLTIQEPNGIPMIEMPNTRGIISAVAWSPDSTKFAFADESKRITVWNIADSNYKNGELIATFSGHQTPPNTLEWSPDGKRLASVSSRDETGIQIWDAINFNPVPSGTLEKRDVIDIAWSPDSKKIAVASIGVFLFDVPLDLSDTSNLTGNQIGENLYVTSVDWQPNGDNILLGYHAEIPTIGLNDQIIITVHNTLLVYSSETGVELLSIEAHEDIIKDVAWSPDGSQFASLSQDGTAKIWDASNGVELLTLPADKLLPRDISWNPNGRSIAYGGAKDSQFIHPFTAQDISNSLRASIVECIPDNELQLRLLTTLDSDDLTAVLSSVEAIPEDTITPECTNELNSKVKFLLQLQS